MGKAMRKLRPSVPRWMQYNGFLDDNCHGCKDKNNCNQCKAARNYQKKHGLKKVKGNRGAYA